MSDWNSEQYIKFEKERTQPSVDLINKIDIDAKTVLDVGCGPGNSTARLLNQYPDAEILGIDNSENMLQKASSTYPDIKFCRCDVPEGLESLKSFDLIFSNACLHWIPNHGALLPKLMEKLNVGGVLAVQMPLVQQAPFYKAVGEAVTEDKWKKLRSIKNFHNLLPDETYDILARVSADVNMWETTYYHIVNSYNDVFEWYKGSGLRPYLDLLGEEEKAEFIADLTEKLEEKFPIRKDGKIILKMPRMFFIARK